jgi:hypothetical protein
MKYSHILTKSNQMTSINNIQRLAKSSIKKNSSKTRTKNKLNPGKPRLDPNAPYPVLALALLLCSNHSGPQNYRKSYSGPQQRHHSIQRLRYPGGLTWNLHHHEVRKRSVHTSTRLLPYARPLARPPSPRPDLQRPEYFDQVPRIDI